MMAAINPRRANTVAKNKRSVFADNAPSNEFYAPVRLKLSFLFPQMNKGGGCSLPFLTYNLFYRPTASLAVQFMNIMNTSNDFKKKKQPATAFFFFKYMLTESQKRDLNVVEKRKK